MKRLSCVGAICLLLSPTLLLSSSLSMAAEIDASVGKTFLMEEILVDPAGTQKSGYLRKLAIPNRFFLAVALEYEVLWDEQEDRLKVQSDQIVLIDDKGQSLSVLGEMTYYSGLKTNFSAISHSRPKNWKDKKKPDKRKLYPVWAIDRPGTKFMLKIGEKELTVEAPDKVDVLGPSTIAKFEVSDAKWIGRVDDKETIGKNKYGVANDPLTGRFLAVTVEITPTPPIPMEETSFFWHTSWFGLLDGSGAFSPVAGEMHSDHFGRATSHNLFKGDSGWKTDSKTLYFAVPPRQETLKLYCLGSPVADVTAPAPD